jgi:hypothetical protein
MVAVVSMSKREFDRLEVLVGVQSGRLRVADACALSGLSRRQVFRLLQGFRENGAASLLSKRRGRPSNRRLPGAVRELAMALVREHYCDFGPTLAAEFALQPDSALCPAADKTLLAQLPPTLRQRWAEWKDEYGRLAARNPKLTLYDMLSWISETHIFTSWPTGWERRIRDWVDAGSLAPMPFDDRLKIITPEFYARLRKVRAECRGWLYSDGEEVRFVPDPG